MSRIQVTPEQFKEMQANQRPLFGEKPKPVFRRGPVAKRPKEEMPENIVEAQCLDFLRFRGWVVQRQHSGVFVPLYAVRQFQEKRRPVEGSMIRIGTKGCCDWRAERPRPGQGSYDCFELELKAPGEKPKPDQVTYMYERNALGYCAMYFDGIRDCANPLEPWYLKTFGR